MARLGPTYNGWIDATELSECKDLVKRIEDVKDIRAHQHQKKPTTKAILPQTHAPLTRPGKVKLSKPTPKDDTKNYVYRRSASEQSLRFTGKQGHFGTNSYVYQNFNGEQVSRSDKTRATAGPPTTSTDDPAPSKVSSTQQKESILEPTAMYTEVSTASGPPRTDQSNKGKPKSTPMRGHPESTDATAHD
ncbi:hypothetical protein TI39_contig620g00006 [Zymoseptoria brevis]|uniref:Uncharacterized protein n=1 Tax=Zymoseptoria brevis TaxID=1047168 RepID=A0A0F4GGI9_9PEZI|nr:hypothetical protein TI39_contig620g00006 [Zymoseptoria brevis]